MASKCPTTEKSWGRKSAAKGCSPKENYHCVQTQDGDVIELCTNAIWIEMGNCPVYTRAGILGSKLCQARVLQTACPPNVYRSNQVFKYTACFPENSISTTSTQTSTLIGKQTIILNTTTNPTSEDAGTGLELLALLILIPFMLGLLVVLYLQRRGYINIHRLCTNGRERSGESSELKSSADKGHWSIDIGENKEETEELVPDDTGIRDTTDEQCSTTMDPKGPLLAGYSVDHFADINDLKERKAQHHEGPVEEDRGNYITDTDTHPPRNEMKTSSNDSEKNTHETERPLIMSVEPDLSMVRRMSEALSRKQMIIITGLPGSGKSTLAYKISVEACRRCTGGGNLRSLNYLQELDKLTNNTESFLILDDCIKSWFNDTCVNHVFEKISKVLQLRKNGVHVVLCAPPRIWNKFCELQLSSAFKYEFEELNLTDVRSYTEEDWNKIYMWHKQRNVEFKKYDKEEERKYTRWKEEYRNHKAEVIGKPAIADLLCRRVNSLKNPKSLFMNPKAFLEMEISGLISWSFLGQKDYNSFVVLIYLMLHNGKAMIDKIENEEIEDIRSAYKISVEHTISVKQVKYNEIEVKGNVVSVRSYEVVRATFDFVWKDHKELIIRHCDDDLFLERITLNDYEEGVAEIAERLKSMINAGKQNVEQHYLLEDSRLKRLVQQ